MRLPVANTQNADKEIGSAKDALIRHLEISPSYALKPTLELHDNNWEVNSPQTVGDFTATGYYFARFLREHHKIPIGLIHSSWSGSRIETWIGNQPTNLKKLSKKQLSLPHHQKDLAYNKMIHPLTKFPIKGVLWYQGEDHTGYPEDAISYFPKLKALLESWRTAWGVGDFPFLYVQLPNYQPPSAGNNQHVWALLREAQNKLLQENNTAQVITIDIGEANNLHPPNKQDIGYRLALAARTLVYGDSIIGRSPSYHSHKFEENKATIVFKDIGEGLRVENPYGYINGFALAGSDHQFLWAKAKLINGEVIVEHDLIPNPQSIRYGWEDNPEEVNLYNSAGLPTAPFQVGTISILSPTYRKHTQTKNALILSFDHIADSLWVGNKEKLVNGFSIAGTDQKFKTVDAYLKDNQVVISKIAKNFIHYIQYKPDTLDTSTLLFNSKGISLKAFQTPPPPVYKNHTIKEDAIHISFEHLNNQLVVNNKYGYVEGFFLLRRRSKPKPIQAKVKGNQIIIPYPTHLAGDRIRYMRTRQSNLYNTLEHPILPFHFLVEEPN